MLFAAFALSSGAADLSVTPAQAGAGLNALPSPLPLPTRQLPPDPEQEQPPDRERDAWAAYIYQRLAASQMISSRLDARLPTVPVVLHPSAPRGAELPPVTARHFGFLRVDLTGESAGPGRFYPLFPAGKTLQRSKGWTRAAWTALDAQGIGLAAAACGCSRPARQEPAVLPCPASVAAAGGLPLLPPDAFAALWARSSGSSSTGDGGSSAGDSAGGSAAPAGWYVPYRHLLPLEEAYGGLYRELKAAGHDLSHCHYMLRGWKTREGRPRLGASAPRSTTGGSGHRLQRQRCGVLPAAVAATRDLRAMVNWPGLLELLEEEGIEIVPTDSVRYWLARLGAGFQARLAAAGVLCADTSVHHIIARSARGIDHPLNYFLIDKGPNSAMGSKVEGFRDANGTKLHMRDIVGERAFEVAHAACNLYHGVLYAGRRRGAPAAETLRELRQGALALAEEALEARREAGARQQAQRAAAGTVGTQQHQQPQQQAEPQWVDQLGSQLRSSLKRERCQRQQQRGGGEAAAHHAPVLSPTTQQQERRRRLSCELRLAPALAAAEPIMAEVGPAAAAAAEAKGEAGEDVEEGLAALSLHCSLEDMPLEGREKQRQLQQLCSSKPAADLSSLRVRLQAALGAAASGG